MLTAFIRQQLLLAKYKLLEDGTYYGHIPRLQGVWAASSKLESCREELREVLESWMALKLQDGDSVPGLQLRSLLSKQPARRVRSRRYAKPRILA